MEIKNVKIKELKPHPKNPRIHPDSMIDKLAKSIEEFGFTNPVLVTKDNMVLAGHARVKAAEKKGLKEVPVVYLDLEGSRADAYLITDNKIQEESKWDATGLRDLLQDLDTGEFDLTMTGFSTIELEGLFNEFDVDKFFESEHEEKEKKKEKITCPECGHEFEQ